MNSDHASLTRFERLLSLVTRVAPGEGRTAFLFFLHGFLLLASYQVVKALREAFMLTKFSAETRAYAVALMALVLMLVVPLYGRLRHHLDGAHLLRVVTIFFVATLPLFAVLAHYQVPIAFAFFIWVGIYGVMVVSQMWAFAADSFNVRSGQRLFVVIMLGANLGALAGSKLTQLAVAALSPMGLMILATGTLGATLFLATPERAAIPEGSRAIEIDRSRPVPQLLGGIGLVLRDRYLLHMALFVVLLNWINTTGEFILADYVKADAVARVADERRHARPGHAHHRVLRQFQFLGDADQPVHPAVSGFAHLPHGRRARRPAGPAGDRRTGLWPAGVRADARRLHSVLLPGSPDQVCGERRRLLADEHHAAGAVPAGRPRLEIRRQDRDRHLLLPLWRPDPGGRRVHRAQHPDVAIPQFCVAQPGAGAGVDCARGVMGRDYARKSSQNLVTMPPEAVEPIPDLLYAPGETFLHPVAPTAFYDAEPGDVLVLHARREDGHRLPHWIRFNVRLQAFTGKVPMNVDISEMRITVIASNLDGLEARSTFVARRATR